MFTLLVFAFLRCLVGKNKHSKEYSVDEFFKNEFSTGCHDCQEPRGFCESLQCLLVLIK